MTGNHVDFIVLAAGLTVMPPLSGPPAAGLNTLARLSQFAAANPGWVQTIDLHPVLALEQRKPLDPLPRSELTQRPWPIC